jgi:hypothetical protein
MIRSRGARITGFAVAVGATAALIAFGVSSTGAYFTDSQSGTITGKMGNIRIDANVVNQGNLNAVFTNMLPGTGQTATVTYKNASTANPEDVWVVFNPTDLGTGDGQTGVNSLGSYGEIHVGSNGVEVFASANLNDHYPCGTVSAGYPTICPLPGAIQLNSSLGVGGTGQMTFSFTPSAKFKNSAQNSQVLKLRYKIVATQVGVSPLDPNNDPFTW